MTIAEKAYALLQNDFTLPIDVTSIALNLGVKVIPYDLNDISGILVIENDTATIGYNRSESRVRNRYSIAHELGHYFLHKDEEHLFVDKTFKVMLRDKSSNRYEREANQFAACLLMPADALIEEMEKLDLDFTDETNIKILASKFDVSAMAMSFRISNLGLL